MYEAYKVEIPVKKLSDISKALEVDPDFFIKDKSSLVVRKSDENLVRKSFVSNENSPANPFNLKKKQKRIKFPTIKFSSASLVRP